MVRLSAFAIFVSSVTAFDEYRKEVDLETSEEGFYRSRHQIQPRRMKQLAAQLVERHGFANYTKIYGYGCYCLNLGERPMSGMVQGVEPVDEIDQVCQKYTQCVKCLKHDHGDYCQPESINYEYYFDENGETVCPTDNKCRKNLCECDKFLAEALDGKFEAYKSENHVFGGFEFSTMCEKTKLPNSGQNRTQECCGEYPTRKPFLAGGSRDLVCCDNVAPMQVMTRSLCESLGPKQDKILRRN
ncbi:Oidioi.mRNA.OKI2018_I69.PAR.g9927.t1.cds [Oikopleura dioica]|uniref:Oidioi.mRNA.OKI2018_I69.PAR.g9927.t1.cds n=1 Tax=Oikopleura dioica TaxID=34765 RepID=A0ABN7RTS8_OIKDI|nr:Oidioi.mRNA.OKI2018_I69.PAR.g9927.t1.cds [Oikopleura dioica]